MSDFHFRSVWETPAPVARVQEALVDLEHYPEWWPQVRAVAKIDDDTARVLCRSALPYTLDLVLHSERRDPTRLEVAISGDLRGWSRIDLTDVSADGPGVTRVDYRQQVAVTGAALAAAARLAGPLLRWNHARMMVGCRDGLSSMLAPDRSRP